MMRPFERYLQLSKEIIAREVEQDQFQLEIRTLAFKLLGTHLRTVEMGTASVRITTGVELNDGILQSRERLRQALADLGVPREAVLFDVCEAEDGIYRGVPREVPTPKRVVVLEGKFFPAPLQADPAGRADMLNEMVRRIRLESPTMDGYEAYQLAYHYIYGKKPKVIYPNGRPEI